MMSITEMMEWYYARLHEGYSGIEMEEMMDEIDRNADRQLDLFQF